MTPYLFLAQQINETAPDPILLWGGFITTLVLVAKMIYDALKNVNSLEGVVTPVTDLMKNPDFVMLLDKLYNAVPKEVYDKAADMIPPQQFNDLAKLTQGVIELVKDLRTEIKKPD